MTQAGTAATTASQGGLTVVRAEGIASDPASPAIAQVALRQTSDAVVVTDPDGRIVSVNAAFERTTGFRADEVVGRDSRLIRDPGQPDSVYDAMRWTLAQGRTWRGELVSRRRDGTPLVEECSITPLRDDAGGVSACVEVRRDVTRLHRLQAGLEDARRERDAFSRTLARLARLAPQVELGDSCRDIAEVLLEIPAVTSACVVIFESRSSARVAAVACANRTPGTPNAELGADLTARIAERRDHEAWIEPLRSPFARSLGAASPGTGVNAHLIVPLLHDQMLLGALIVGGADVSGMDLLPQVPAVTEVAALAMSLVVPHMVETLAARVARVRIEGIIATSAFETVFQPIVDLETGTAVGFEGLSRFDGGDDPAELFAAAAACGAGHALERATLRATLVAARDLPADAWVSLNVSPTLALAGETLAGLLADQPRLIVVELTEHSPIADYGALREGLASLGPSIRVAVDGTGVGAANLRHLVELQPDFVKLDDSLVRCIDEDATRQALVVGLGAFARMSGRDLIAKGVETLPERDTLARLGVRLAQGYLLGGPAPAAAWARNGLAEP